MNNFLPLRENIAQTIISISAKNKKRYFRASEEKEKF